MSAATEARAKAEHVISVLVPDEEERDGLSGFKLQIVQALEGLLELVPDEEIPAPDPVVPVDSGKRHLPANVLEALDRIGG